MGSILLRDFEIRDVDFIYKCKSDEKLNQFVVGNFRKLSYEESVDWVKGVIRADRKDMKFWAICTNDDERRIVGWMSLSNIDHDNRAVCHHGIFIGDKDYQDGIAMFESMLLSMDYVFNKLCMHRIYGMCLSIHNTSPHMLNALGFSLEGVRKDAVIKNGNYCDILEYALLEDKYRENIKSGYYQLEILTRNFVKSLKRKAIV